MTMPEMPQVITLCGSTRFKDTFERMQETFTLAGAIVISVGSFGHADDRGYSDEQKEMLDELHKRKIDISDGILVINVNGYIGKSTRSEIDYAKKHGKNVAYVDHQRRPQSWEDAVYLVANTFPPGFGMFTANDVHEQMQLRWPGCWPLMSTLDVANTLREVMT